MPPKSITPKDLLENLTFLTEPDRTVGVKWKGKLTPEGWVLNVKSESREDKHMVEQLINCIKEQQRGYGTRYGVYFGDWCIFCVVFF